MTRYYMHYTLVEHEACGWRWWSEGELPPIGDCVSCGMEQPEMTVLFAKFDPPIMQKVVGERPGGASGTKPASPALTTQSEGPHAPSAPAARAPREDVTNDRKDDADGTV